MIKYVLFDLDGTILDFHKGERTALIATINEFSNHELLDDEILLFSEINERLFNEYASGKMKRIEFQEKRFEEISKSLNINLDYSLANKFFLSTLRYTADIYDDVIPALEYLSKKYTLLIASNGITDIQTKRLDKAGILQLFTKIYASEEIVANKPDIKFFDYIFNDLNDYDKSKYIIIGDRLETDILGGINANIKTVLINRDNVIGDIIPDYEIFDLNVLKNIL